MQFIKPLLIVTLVGTSCFPVGSDAQGTNDPLMDLIVSCNQALNRGDAEEALRIAPMLLQYTKINEPPYNKYAERCVSNQALARKVKLIKVTLAACDRLHEVDEDAALLSPVCNNLYIDYYLPEFRTLR